MPSVNYVLATIPTFWGWTSYTPVIPKLYWDVYSQEERIKRLCLEYDKLTHYASYVAEQVNDLASTIDETLDDFLSEQDKKVDEALEYMRNYIDERFADFTASQRVYDVTTGTYRPSTQTMRRLFQALSYDHKGDEQLVSYYANNNTVSEMAEHTVYNVAYSNRKTVTIDDQSSNFN